MRHRAGPRSLLLALIFALCQLASSQPESTPFEPAWGDLAPFSTDLRDEFEAHAFSLEGAPSYRLDWELQTPTRLRARQEVRVVNYSEGQTWQRLYFHLHPNLLGAEFRVESLTVDERPQQPRYPDENRLLEVVLPSGLEPGGATVVALEYELRIPTQSDRNYGILGFSEGVLSLAHGYAMLAVFDEEGWDLDAPPSHGDMVHARSSFFSVRLNAPVDFDLVASGRQLARRVEGSRQLLEYAAGPVRDFYLAGAEELIPVQSDGGVVSVRGHALPGHEEAMERAVEQASAALEIFGQRYGHYPYREFDLVEIATTALGVEFPGVIALRRQLLATPQGDELLESTVVHEVAHQWFYGTVGSDQVSEPWLDESVTQYLTLRYCLERYGAPGYREYRESLLSRWEQIDRRTVPIGLPVERYSEREYGAVIYGLGPLVVEWLQDALSRPSFDRFLRAYIEENLFGIADGAEFRELAEEFCDCGLTEFFDRWIGRDQ